MRQHRHTPHRMPDQDHRTARRQHGEHGVEVAAELRDGIGARCRGAGLAVPALVVEHHPDLIAPHPREFTTLKVEGAHVHTEAVREHHGDGRIGGPDLPDRQVDAVGRGHHTPSVGVQQAEILTRVKIFDRDAPGHGARRGRTRHRPHRRQPRHARHPAPSALCPAVLRGVSHDRLPRGRYARHGLWGWSPLRSGWSRAGRPSPAPSPPRPNPARTGSPRRRRRRPPARDPDQ